MKTIKIFTVSILVALSMSLSAQIKVNSTGKVGINNPNPSRTIDAHGDYYFRINNSLYDFGLKLDGSADISGPGNSVTLYSNGPGFLGKSDSYWYKAYISNLHTGSDERFKTNITEIDNALTNIIKVKPVSYNYSDYFLTNFVGLSNAITRENSSKKHLGFVAQQLLPIFPELVELDSNTMHYSVDYLGMIPILVEAIKDLESELQIVKSNINKSKLKSATIAGESIIDETLSSGAILYQNNPNPFSENTEIKYFLPDNVKSATLYIYNMQGNQIKSIPLYNRGEANETIHGSELQAGMYIYALIADGKEIDSKRMILTD